MLSAHTVQHVREAEASAAAQVGWDRLMQRAAAALAEQVAALVPAELTMLVLVGPGNNGGDALFAAQRLLGQGRRVNLLLLDADHVHPAGLAAALDAGAVVVDAPEGHRVVIDALFGIGARPGLSGRAAGWAAWVDQERPLTIAVDVPSGIGVDDGTLPGPHLRADHTITFGTYKIGSLVGPAALAAGQITLVDIGLGPHLGPADVEAWEPGDGERIADQVVPSSAGHKYSRGVLGIDAGSPQYAGAAHLCVGGAQAGPIGMIRFVGADELARRVVDRAPEVVVGRGRVQAWVVGPGGIDSPEPLRAALADRVPVLVDASALAHLPDAVDPTVLLTPHAGELAALVGVDRAEVEADPLAHARAAAARWGATVLLKGPRTVVVGPDGRARVNLSGNPWLGTAGSGDVLAGFTGSLLAAGLDPLDAGSLGAFLHGRAGELVNPGGPFVASDLARVLPRVVADFLKAGAA